MVWFGRFLRTLALWLTLIPVFAAAQTTDAEERDIGFLTRMIEDNLNSVGRTVTIDGFDGALSSTATIDRMSIADSQGVWLVAENMRLNWNRAALFRGRIEVRELRAETITLIRPPVSDSTMPSPEASPFALPDLPVAINIGQMQVGRVALGRGFLGTEVALSLSGTLSLAGGEGSATLTATRLDGPQGSFALVGAYSNATQILTVNLDVNEAPAGILSTLLNLPGDPSLSLQLAGTGPITDFGATLDVATDGVTRITGEAGLLSVAGADGAATAQEFRLDVRGDVTTLIAPQYREFFGPEVSLAVQGSRAADGALTLSKLDVSAQSLTLTGSAELQPDGWPRRLALQGELAAADGSQVLLPGGGGATTVRRVTLDVGYDVEQDAGWTGTFALTDLGRPGLTVPQLLLQGRGVIVPATDATPGRFTADMTYGATGVALDDPKLATAIGDTIDGEIRLLRDADGPFQITRLTLTGPGITANAEGTIAGPGDGFLTQSSVTLTVADAARFGPLTGLDLGGAAEMIVVSSIKPLDGMFDILLTGNARDLSFGIAALDPLLAGESLLSLTAVRDTGGTRIDGLSLNTPALRADGSLRLTSGASDAVFDLTVADAGRALPGLSGPATLRGTASRTDLGVVTLDVTADLPGSTAAINATIASPEGGGAITGSVLADIGDLSPFADLTGIPLSGAAEAVISGTVLQDGSLFDVTAFARTTDVTTGLPQVDALLAGAGQFDGRFIRTGPASLRVEGLNFATPAIRGTATVNLADGAGDADLDIRLTDIAPLVPGLTGPVTLTGTAARDAAGIATLDLKGTGPGASVAVAGTVDTAENGYAFTGQARATVAEVAPYATMVGQNVSGAVDLTANGTIRPDLTRVDLRLTGTTQDLQSGITAIDPLLTGAGTINAVVNRAGADDLTVTDLRIATPQANLTGGFDIADGLGGANLNLSLPDIAPVAPGFSGPARLTGTATRDAEGIVTLALNGQAPGTTAVVAATIAGADAGYLTQTRITASVADLAAWSRIAGRPLGGSVDTTITGSIQPGARVFDLTVNARTTNLNPGVPVAATLLRGTGTLDGRVRLTADRRVTVEGLALRFPNLTVTGDITSRGETGQARFDARLADVGLLVSEFSGPATATGTATLGAGGAWQLQVNGTGPGGTTLAVRGTVSPGLALNLTATGSAPLGLVNGIIEPNRIDGTAGFDLRVQGPFTLDSVSGTIRTDGARLALPGLRIALPGVGGTVRIAGGRATVDMAGGVEGGGRITATGTVGLTSPFAADLRVTAAAVSLRDATLYETTASGTVSVTGPLTGGALIAGTIDLGTTEIQVPSSGVGVLGDLPEVLHIGPSAAVVQTLARAGLTAEGGIVTGTRGSTAGVYALDLTVRAPARVFIRGRGLDAEMGGEIGIGGTTAGIIPRGQFDLIRGRLVILEQRFDLTEGSFTLQGDFVPILRLVARTEARTGTVIFILVQGRITEPDVTFTSAPDLPQDEVLAQLIFGRDLSSISPLQAIQLASAVATLAGRGGGGLIEGFRQSTGLDDFDITTDSDGNAAVRAGRYLSDNVYTDVTVGARETEINLNFDVTSDLTIKGSVSSDGNTALGIYFERDY